MIEEDGMYHHCFAGETMHTIEELSDTILKVTEADPNLVRYKNSEVLTTTVKKVDVTKAIRDLQHKNTYDLERGTRLTAQWMSVWDRVQASIAGGGFIE